MDQGLFYKAITLLDNYRKDQALTTSQVSALDESVVRLTQTVVLYDKAHQINGFLLDGDPVFVEMDELTRTGKLLEILREQSKLDPALAAVLPPPGQGLELIASTKLSAYKMEKLNPEFNDRDAKLLQLQQDVESIYNNLWHLKTRLESVPKFESFNPPGVRDVRNHLITHTEGPGSGASIFSVGVSPNGPVLRPFKPIGVKAPNDKGLDSNIEEYLTAIIKILK